MKRTLFIIMFALILSILGCYANPPSDDEVKIWFNKHRDTFLKLKEYGEKYPKIHRVEPAIAKHPHHFSELGPKDEKAVAEITQILAKIDSDFVVYWREGSEETGELFCISIPYYRWGVLGGYYKGIEYVVDKETLKNLSRNKGEYKELGQENWYIHEFDSSL